MRLADSVEILAAKQRMTALVQAITEMFVALSVFIVL
jgi:hypothetical protein